MKNYKIYMAIMTVFALNACSGNQKEKTNGDTSAITTDTSVVKAADSTHSFRNDRGTDSVSSGKSVPAKP